MIIAVHGHNKFNDYPVFLAGMGKALKILPEGDSKIFLYSAGPRRINEMSHEWTSVSDFKSYGLSVQLRRVPFVWLKENMPYIDYLAYFGMKKETMPDILRVANAKDVRNDMYRYNNVA